MRPLTLKITAFGPYAAEQVVDFRKLGEKRFFLIHGPTGAGKTSVLDAMTFALYGSTTGEERSGKDMRSLFADPAVTTEVSFDFAVGADRYRVWRRPEQLRPKQRGEGFTKDKPEASLYQRTAVTSDQEDGDLLASGVRDVDARVRELLGFDCDQFRQVVVLPQGRFREVLSADVKTREEILKQLFKTDRYARVTEFLKARRNEARSAVNHAISARSGVLENEGVGSREQLVELVEAARVAAAEAHSAHGIAAATAEQARTALEAARNAHAALAEAAAAAGLLAELTAKAGDFAAKREELAGARRAQAVHAAFEARDRAVRELTEATGERDEAAAKLPELQAAEKHACELAEGAEAAAAEQHEIERLEAAVAEATRKASDAARVAKLRDAVAAAAKALEGAVAHREQAGVAAAQAVAAVEAAEARWRSGQAAVLAATLEAGAPCPVCGSMEHPDPVAADAQGATDEELEAARAAERASLEAAAKASERVVAAETALATARETASAEEAALGAELAAADHEGLSADAKRLTEELGVRRAAAKKAADDLAECQRKRESAKSALAAGLARAQAATERVERAEKARAQAVAELSTALSGAGFESEKQALELRRAPAELDAIEGAIRKYEGDLAAAKSRDERARKAVEAVKTPPDIAELERVEAEARAAAVAASSALGAAQKALDERTGSLETIDRFDAESAELTKRYELVASLADAADGTNDLKLSFQRYVLGTYLDEVLVHANYRFQRMTGGRYRLERSTDVAHRGRASGLALSVHDEHASESRPAGTLSGGEGFLASLALALGLAEAVQAHAGGVKLETVFIDEGFGTLDAEALELAITTLLDLAGVAAEQGRLVGIISHVAELQQRIDARLEVVQHERGSSARFVV